MKHQPRHPYDKKQLELFRERLVTMLRSLRGDTEFLAEEVLQPSGQDSGFENPADFGSDAFSEELQIEVLEDRAAVLQQCQEALDRLDGLGDYQYGLCKPCTKEPQRLCSTCPWIPAERLSYLPYARHCVPVEEELEEGRAAQVR
jgi:RNA polymerase-binding transcription factor DksA